MNRGAPNRRFSSPLAALLLVALALAATGCFPRGAGSSLAHFHDLAPKPGDPAPRFALNNTVGERVTLEDLLGERPVVLQFGSHTCPVYRYRRFWMERLHRDFADRVEFLTIYTVEAHPTGAKSPYAEGEWVPWINRVDRSKRPQPATFEERCAAAARSKRQLESPLPMVIDRLDNEVWSAYGEAPSPAFVLDRAGIVVESMVWIDPKRIRKALEALLAAD